MGLAFMFLFVLYTIDSYRHNHTPAGETSRVLAGVFLVGACLLAVS